jgi:hypothetical protein
MINLIWSKELKNKVTNFQMDLMQFPESLNQNKNYYISSYACPNDCYLPLYKLKVRGESTLFQGKTLQVFNLFTCPKCKIFLCSVSQPGEVNNYTSTPLSSYALATNTISSETEYNKMLKLYT